MGSCEQGQDTCTYYKKYTFWGITFLNEMTRVLLSCQLLHLSMVLLLTRMRQVHAYYCFISNLFLLFIIDKKHSMDTDVIFFIHSPAHGYFGLFPACGNYK